MMMFPTPMMWIAGIAYAVFYLALLTLIILAIAWLIRSLRTPPPHTTGHSHPGAQPGGDPGEQRR
jgi:hypothetical protein